MEDLGKAIANDEVSCLSLAFFAQATPQIFHHPS
jgi:hypothetical protein